MSETTTTTDPVETKPAAAATGTATATTSAQTALGETTAPASPAAAAVTAPTPKWPEDWRQQLMGEDAEKRGNRYSAPGDVWKAYRALETKLSSGEYKQVVAKPAADAKPEDVAAYRKSVGVPDTAEGYLTNLPGGLVIDKPDTPLMGKFLERMHAQHAPPEMVHAAIQSYFDVQQAVGAEMAQADETARQGATDTLYTEWGNEARGNFNAIGGFIRATFGDDLAAALTNARMADGTLFGNSIPGLKAFLQVAKELNPAATIVPGHGGSSAQGIESRLGEIQKMRKENATAYWRNEKVQEEERRLIEAQQRSAA